MVFPAIDFHFRHSLRAINCRKRLCVQIRR